MRLTSLKPAGGQEHISWVLRKSTSLSLFLLLVLSSPVLLLVAQQRAPGRINEAVTAVLVDVVVRDRRGQPVRDLTMADFEVLEDGARQTIDSFTPFLVASAPSSGRAITQAALSSSAPVAAGTPPPAAQSPSVMAIVFDSMSPQSRRSAVQAAQRYIGTKEETANFVGIFGLDLTLRPLVPFTRNGVTVRQALNLMASGASPNFTNTEAVQQADQAAAAASLGASGVAEGGPGASAAMVSAGPAAQLAQMQARMIQDFERMARDQQGYAQTDGLFAIINTLGRLPGRKSVVLFSEGIAIPERVHRLYLGVIDAANRANVSIYTLDAAGLRVGSDQARIRDIVNGASPIGSGAGYSAEGGTAYTRVLEGTADSLRSDPHYSLGTLAEDTGGLLFNRSNNLAEGFERIETDLVNYYVLGYTPTNTAYDGKFRKIEVKVKRPGVTIAARKGYFAVRNPGGAPVNAWEALALGALEQKPIPNAFPIRAGALLFPERGRPGLVPVVVELKTAPLTFQPASDGKTYSSDFTVLVRFLDKDNQVARKVSQHYEIRGELARIEGAKRGEVVFYRESELAPGVYSMEAVVHDALSGQSSVRYSTVEVPRHNEGKLRVSSLVLVKRGETVPEKERRAENPLLVNGVALSPNLGDPVSKTLKELPFYFAVYPAAGGPAPEVTIQLVQNGVVAAQVPMTVPAADRSGRVQQLGHLPLAQIAPGTYELRAVVKQGTEQVTRSTLLRVE
jgi:VWFA-related protein